MKLNFPDPKNDAPKLPTTAANDFTNDNLPEGLQTFSEWQFEAATAIMEKEANKREAKQKKNMQIDARAKRERAERYVMLKMGRLLQGNIITAGRLVEHIFKAANEGRPPEEIALYAVKALALLLNDPMLYGHIADRYRERYGLTMNEKPPYEMTRLPDPEK